MSTICANVPIQFNLASISVTLVSAVEKDGGDTHRYCTGADAPHEATRIKATQHCPTCHRTGWNWQEGVERDGGVVLLDKDEIAALTDPSTRTTMVVSCHKLDEVLSAAVPGDTVYFLKPGKLGAKKNAPTDVRGYRLLRELLRRNPSKAVVTVFATRTKAKLWRLALVGDVITMQSLCWPEDLKALPEVPAGDAEPEEFKAANALLRSVTRPFNLEDYRDAARAARAELIGAAPVAEVAAPTEPQVAEVSLLDALRASVEQVQKGKATAA